jgi:hypothetical protein
MNSHNGMDFCVTGSKATDLHGQIRTCGADEFSLQPWAYSEHPKGYLYNSKRGQLLLLLQQNYNGHIKDTSSQSLSFKH